MCYYISMNEKSVELAQMSLSTFSDCLSPEYQRIRQDLLAELAIHGAQLDDGVLVETQGAANYNLISHFIDDLPNTYRSSFNDPLSLITDKPFDALALKASTIWLEDLSDYDPYYVVGIDSNDVCIIVKPKEKDGGREKRAREIFALKLKKDDVLKVKKLGNIIYKTPKVSEIEDMRSRSDKMLHVSSKTPGVIRLRAAKFSADSTFRYSGRLKPIEWISDNDLNHFGIPDYLNNLATLFNKQSELNQLLTLAAVE